jgi:hypothetical protein
VRAGIGQYCKERASLSLSTQSLHFESKRADRWQLRLLIVHIYIYIYRELLERERERESFEFVFGFLFLFF